MSQPQQQQYSQVDGAPRATALNPTGGAGATREFTVTCKKCRKPFKTFSWDKTWCGSCVSLAHRVYKGSKKYRRY